MKESYSTPSGNRCSIKRMSLVPSLRLFMVHTNWQGLAPMPSMITIQDLRLDIETLALL